MSDDGSAIFDTSPSGIRRTMLRGLLGDTRIHTAPPPTIETFFEMFEKAKARPVVPPSEPPNWFGFPVITDERMQRDRVAFMAYSRIANLPHWVTVSNADYHRRRADDALGWMRAEWHVRGRPRRRSLVAMFRHEFLACWYGAMPDGGGQHHRYDANARNRYAIITGITA